MKNYLRKFHKQARNYRQRNSSSFRFVKKLRFNVAHIRKYGWLQLLVDVITKIIIRKEFQYMDKEKYLVTSALPYANGDLHLGHIAGAYLPADIFVRYLKLNGKDVIYICGTDEHGTPVSIEAEKEGVSPQEIAEKYHNIIKKSFKGLLIEFDNFSGTARTLHHKLSQKFFLNLLKNGYITKHTNEHLYCPNCNRFLPDRYVEGICPYCKSSGARGDQCDICGKLIDATKLINPTCIICGGTPEVRETTHWFLDLPKFSDRLTDWINSRKEWKDNVKSFVLGWIKTGLKERPITRDLNWGIPVPLKEAKGKVLYVWFEAPIGYISSTIEWAEKIGQPNKWEHYWLNKDTKLIHFIGKDNIPFHSVIWPSMLMGQDEQYVLPTDIPANEYLNLEGQQFSTSKNWAIWISDYLQCFQPDPLRYTIAANAPENKDSDFRWRDFQNRNNNELADTLGNFVNRVLRFANKNFGEIPYIEKLNKEEQKIIDEIKHYAQEIGNLFFTYQVRKATRRFMDLARFGNQFFDKQKPWKNIKIDRDKAKSTIYLCGEIIRNLAVIMYPVIPQSAEKVWNMLSLKSSLVEYGWDNIGQRVGHSLQIGKIETLFPKIDDDKIEKQIEKLEKQSNSRHKKH
ncbi:MAG: methionine--tRNA ligase [Candidatus Cloacimonadota bacterium]|nr:MAG: methionine--tRNA ligase [Candidatus Cloacimonadota bacterium]